MKNLFKRLKLQKGMSGVLVALLLVVVGVGLVAGVKTFMDNAKDELLLRAQSAVNDTNRTNVDVKIK